MKTYVDLHRDDKTKKEAKPLRGWSLTLRRVKSKMSLRKIRRLDYQGYRNETHMSLWPKWHKLFCDEGQKANLWKSRDSHNCLWAHRLHFSTIITYFHWGWAPREAFRHIESMMKKRQFAGVEFLALNLALASAE